jgi:hypothetical protein
MKKATPLFVFLLALSACGGSGTTDTTSPAADTAAPVTSDAAAGKLAPVTIDVTVGVDSGAERREPVAVGVPVTVNLVNPDGDDEFHLHGYDLSTGETLKGETSTISFTADKTGEFELESHVSGEVLVVLVVS